MFGVVDVRYWAKAIVDKVVVKAAVLLLLLLLCKDDYLISSVGDMCTKRKKKTRSS